ncbi:MAG: tyrosine-type recombinase/integrase [Planctomycetota bacterium]|jgi:integrase
MRLFKPSYRAKDGSIRKVAKWWFETKDHLSRTRRFAGFTDKAATRTLAEKTDKLVICKLNREPPGRELSAWLQTIPAKLRDKFIEYGLLPKGRAVSSKPLLEHVADFESWLKTTKSRRYGCARDSEYVKGQCSKIRKVFNGCKFVQWTDIDKEKVERFLGGLDVSSKTHNYYQQAVKQFCEWMVDTNKADNSPLARLKKIREDDDEYRRALSFDEVGRLLATTEKEPKRFGMTGHERAVLYLIGIETGLRRRELESLTVSSFDFDNAVVVADAEFCKNRKRAEQPLKHKRAEQLRGFFAGKEPDAKAFNMPDHRETAEMLKADLEPAGIPYIDDAGRKADFHALRHTLATNLDQTDASMKERAAIMRHSVTKGNLTLGTYTHVRPFDLRRAIEALPDFVWPGEQAETLAATGTDDAEPVTDAVAPQPENLASYLACKGGKHKTTMDDGGRSSRIQVNCQANENLGADGKNGVFVGLSNEKPKRPYPGRASQKSDSQSGLTHRKSRDTKPKERISAKTQNDLASHLAEIAQKDPDLAEIVKAWPDLPEHIKAAIKALAQTHIQGKK